MNNRYYSLDVFRGATVAAMILVNNPGSWSHLYSPLGHAQWHGCTPTDLVFPFFLFAVGNAMSFVMPRLQASGTSAFLKKVFTRSLLIFLIGLLLHWLPFVQYNSAGELIFKPWYSAGDPPSGIRIPGVLQRIAVCYLFASLIIYFFKVRGAFLLSAIMLLGYWAIVVLLGDSTDPYSLEGFIGTRIDRAVFGTAHIYKGEGVPFDPEGLLSTIPAIVSVIFGYFTGDYIQRKGKNFDMLSHLLLAGVILVFAGMAWDLAFPINKKIWTSSYVLYTSGLANLVLAVVIYLVEFREYRGNIAKFFDVFGKNALFIYFLSGFIPRMLGLIRWVDRYNEEGKPVYTSALGWFYKHICEPVSDNLKNGSLLFAVAMVLMYWAIGYLLHRKKIYIRV